jgi:LacI family transcriptional regulator
MQLSTESSEMNGIRQLAQNLGVSIGTVSRALNNRAGVSPRTRARVLEEARRSGYVANAAARALKDQPVLNIGLIFSPFFGPHHEINPAALSLLQLLKETAATKAASLKTNFFTTDEDLKNLVETNHFDVVILDGQFSPSTFETVHQTGIPAVILGYHSAFPNQISVCVNMESAGDTAVQYLAALGHERIGLVTGPRKEPHATEFHNGVKRALGEFALPYRPNWILELPADKANKFGAEAALTGYLRQNSRPTAIIFSTDWMALGGLSAAKKLKLRVPEDLSIIGFQNTMAASEVAPPLTTFDPDHPRFAELVIDLALKLRTERQPGGTPPASEDILISATLIKRQSCACLRAI